MAVIVVRKVIRMRVKSILLSILAPIGVLLCCPVHAQTEENPATATVANAKSERLGQVPNWHANTRPPLFSVSTNWEVADTSTLGATPPDPTFGISNTQIVVCAENLIRGFTKGGSITFDVAPAAFFSTWLRDGSVVLHPRVAYDRLASRWVFTAIDRRDGVGHADKLIMVCSDNATIDSDTVLFGYGLDPPTHNYPATFDNVSIGLSNRGVIIAFDELSKQNGAYWGSTCLFFSKPQFFDRSLRIYSYAFTPTISPRAVSNDDPVAEFSYYLGKSADDPTKLRWVSVHIPLGGTALSSPTLLDIPATTFPIAPQPKGSLRPISALDDRILSARIEKDASPGSDGAFTCWAVQAVGLDASGISSDLSDRTGLRWYQLAIAEDGSAALGQSGTLFDATSAKVSYWNGSITMTGQGTAIIGCTSGGPNVKTAITAAQRRRIAAPGTLDNPAKLYSYNSTYNDSNGITPMPWGRTSETLTDPTDAMTAWTLQMTAKTNTDYAIRMTKLKAPAPPVIDSISPNSGHNGQSFTVSVHATSAGGTAFFDPGPGYERPSVHIAGVTTSNLVVLSKTSLTFTATVDANAPPGAWDMVVSNGDRQSATLASAFSISAPAGLNAVLPPKVSSGNKNAQGMVTIPAVQASDATVNLSSDSKALTVPSAVTIPAGQRSALFTFTTITVPAPITVHVTGTFGGGTATASTVVHAPELTDMSISVIKLIGGVDSLHVTLTVDRAAARGGLTIPVVSNDPCVSATSITIPQGSKVGAADMVTHAVNSAHYVNLSTSWQGVDKTATLLVLVPNPSGLSFSLASVPGGSDTPLTLTVTMPVAAPTGGFSVPLYFSRLLDMTTPVLIPEGATFATIPVTTHRVTFDSVAEVRDIHYTIETSLTLTPSGVQSIAFAPGAPVGGSNQVVTGTITLKEPAPGSGVDIPLSSLDPSVTTPASVHVAGGATSATFNVTTKVVWVATNAVIQANYLGLWAKTLMVKPVLISTVSPSPSSVKGGSSSLAYMRVGLNMTVGTTPVSVSLSSDNTGAAEVPATYSVPSGQSYVLVPITHHIVPLDTIVHITATLPTGSVSAAITIKR